ncbi:MerR family transcriptional regulator [Lactobacillus sp. S2-2]|uniref:MerR family transcriptional regulator n=1 Tax=Lactobacillus sp. S2-2 TaxID=2692917 RepID=UPI001EFF7FDC|nr:MerR family transcriptional regulator [Lactobacillus sp. S2-2]MCF6515618.1 MerR family transcriptional regulator [Lactobacillus sp. S2-2]
MGEKDLRKSMSVLTIGTVIRLTSLTARQIRYYGDQGLVFPERTESNQRLYSLNDIDRILEIKDYLDEGMNIHDIKRIYYKQQLRKSKKGELTDVEARNYLKDDFLNAGRLNKSNDFRSNRL